jgi:hypothetical protein
LKKFEIQRKLSKIQSSSAGIKISENGVAAMPVGHFWTFHLELSRTIPAQNEKKAFDKQGGAFPLNSS